MNDTIQTIDYIREQAYIYSWAYKAASNQSLKVIVE